MSEMDDDELLAALGVEVAPTETNRHTPREERIIAGFEDILRFHQTHGRLPQHGDDRDIFERLYAVRLDQLRKLPEARPLLAYLDVPKLLGETPSVAEPDDDDLLKELGVSADAVDTRDITVLRNVRSYAEKTAAEEIAHREKCEDFDRFKPLFEQVQRDLQSGVRKTIRLETRSLNEIQKGTYFIVGGQVAYIAEEKGEFITRYERRDMRLRVVYDNGTENEVLQRSLQRALHRDEVARLITAQASDAGPLFGDSTEPDDIESGTIYILRSRSDNPFVAQHRELIHKIGVTGGKVETRIAGAENDATYLLAGVDVVAEYRLHNISRTKMENIFHRLFAAAQLDLTIPDRFGRPVKPREWFLVPLHVIDEAVKRIVEGTAAGMTYDPSTAQLVRQ